MTPVDSILARLLALHPKRIDLSLDRMRRVLERLGSPEKRVPPTIHVAGTNGKGSTIAFLRAMLEAAGKSVHVYTSPNLVRVNERFRLGSHAGGMLVSDDELVETLAECERANGESPITLFEIETAAAFVLFARHPADYLLLEVGLGGRLDATNVVERPLASVVTPVSMDHVEFLGDTIEKIASEKAGIFRAGVPAVIAPQTDLVAAVLERHAERARAPLHASGQQWHSAVEHGRLVYQDERGLLDMPPPRLFGRHQFDNAGTAIAALRAAGVNLPARAIEQGLTRAEWPARLQRLTKGPLVQAAPNGAEIWLDGGHNPHGGAAIAQTMADLEERAPKPLYLICGMLKTKDAHGFLSAFRGLARHVSTLTIPGEEASFGAGALYDEARAAGLEASPADDMIDAMLQVAAYARAREDEGPPRILVCGSLYLAGKVLTLNS